MGAPSVAATARTTRLLRTALPFAAQQPSARSRRAGVIARSAARRAGSSCSAMAAAGGDAAAATAAAAPQQPAPATLWQRITERYDAAQRDAAATMTETNTGGWLVKYGPWHGRRLAAKS